MYAMMSSGSHVSRSRSGGFTLVEVLVAAVVLGIGLLGLAALHATTLKMNQGAALRSQADQLIYEITDAMRANRDAALAGDYNLSFAESPSGSDVPSEDLIAWRTRLSQALPQGNGAISVVNATAQVSVRWNTSAEAGQDQTSEFVVETRL